MVLKLVPEKLVVLILVPDLVPLNLVVQNLVPGKLVVLMSIPDLVH